jgi:hypothetical protein
MPTSNLRSGSFSTKEGFTMSKSDLIPDTHKAPKEHAARSGASKLSGFQDDPSKFADQGSNANESEVTTSQRVPQKRTNEVSVADQSAHFDQARRDGSRND